MTENQRKKKRPPFYVPTQQRVVMSFYPGQVHISVDKRLKNGQYRESWSSWIGYRLVTAFLIRWHSGNVDSSQRADVIRSAEVVPVDSDSDILPEMRRIGHASDGD